MLRKLRKNNEGAALIEFALLAPVFFYLIFGIVEVFTLQLSEGILESATRHAARSGLTGYIPDGLSRDDYILQQVKAESFFVDEDNIRLETLVYSDFADIGEEEPYTDENGDTFYDIGEPYTDVNGNGQWDSDMGAAGYGDGGDIVVYKISYDWQFLTPFIGEFLTDDGNWEITSSVVVRNEPY